MNYFLLLHTLGCQDLTVVGGGGGADNGGGSSGDDDGDDSDCKYLCICTCTDCMTGNFHQGNV